MGRWRRRAKAVRRGRARPASRGAIARYQMRSGSSNAAAPTGPDSRGSAVLVPGRASQKGRPEQQARSGDGRCARSLCGVALCWRVRSEMIGSLVERCLLPHWLKVAIPSGNVVKRSDYGIPGHDATFRQLPGAWRYHWRHQRVWAIVVMHAGLRVGDQVMVFT